MITRRILLAAASALALSGPLSAQELDEIRMGYIADYFGSPSRPSPPTRGFGKSTGWMRT